MTSSPQCVVLIEPDSSSKNIISTAFPQEKDWLKLVSSYVDPVEFVAFASTSAEKEHISGWSVERQYALEASDSLLQIHVVLG
jgi:hypothetical protein